MTQVPLFSSEVVNDSQQIVRSIERALKRSWYVLGEEVRAFEAEFASYQGGGHCVSLANGTDALELGLRALGIGRGDLVGVVANAGFYSSTAVRQVGAVPVYVDVDDSTLTMCPRALETAFRRPLKAVIATHLYGQIADVTRLGEICRRFKVPWIEDCAQSHGAHLSGRKAGSFSDLATFSFYPTKNLGAIGDGGAVVTSSPELHAKLLNLRQYGWTTKYHVTVPGGRNSRLDEVQAAVLRDKLPLLDRCNEQRREIARRYCEAFKKLPLKLPSSIGTDFVSHLFVVRSPQRDPLRNYLKEKGVATEVHYPVPDYRQTAYAVEETYDCPVTDRATGEILTLPCFPGMTGPQVDQVIAAVMEFHQR